MSEHTHSAGAHHSHAKTYVITGVSLAIITAIELVLPFIEQMAAVTPYLLVFLSVIKLAAVIAIFMHLKGDHGVYQFLFLPPMGIAVAAIVILGAMAIRTYVPFGVGEPRLAVEKALDPPRDVWPEDKLQEAYAAGLAGGFTDGKELYDANCASCHRNDGGGQTGPAFVDNCWLHGPQLADHVSVLMNGVRGTQMVSFKERFNDDQLRALAFYVHSFQGKPATNPKACQGKEYN